MIRPDQTATLSALQRSLLDSYQRDVPITAQPFQAMGGRLGASEADVLAALGELRQHGIIDRLGPVFRPGRAGASTLAAMAVPREDLARVACIVNEFNEVNHNYEREHAFNLWFVVTAENERRVAAVLDEIHVATGLEVLDLPLEHSYHIDLGFAL